MKLFKYLIIVSITSYSLLYVLFLCFRKGSDRYYVMYDSAVREMIRGNTNYDLLFIGSSRTRFIVNPKIVDSITSKNSFNAGIIGANLVEMNLMLQCYLEKHAPPKLLVADLALNAFDTRKAFFDPKVYYPFLNDSVIYHTLNNYKKRTFLLKYLPFTQLMEADDNQKLNAFYGCFGRYEKIGRVQYKGYLDNTADTISLPFVGIPDTYDYKNNYQITPNGLKILDEIIATCNKYNIKLIFTYAPEFYLGNNRYYDFFTTVNRISAENKIPFYDYRYLDVCKDNKLFVDESHLNKTGAEKFSRILAADLKACINAYSNFN